MRRRDFIKVIVGSAAAWPLAAHAQQPSGVRRIGVLLSTGEGDRQRQAQLAAIVQRLTELGWAAGRNARLDVRWTAGNVDAARKYATELVALAPDVNLTPPPQIRHGTGRTRAGRQTLRRPRARPKKVGRIFGPRRWISAVPDWR